MTSTCHVREDKKGQPRGSGMPGEWWSSHQGCMKESETGSALDITDAPVPGTKLALKCLLSDCWR